MQNLFYRILYFIGGFFRRAENYYAERNRQNWLLQNCTTGKGTIIYNDALIQNHRKDAGLIRIGNDTHVHSHLMLFGHGGEITVGNDCYLGEQSKIWSAAKITIGNRVLIAHNVNIHDNNSHPIDAEERHKDFKSIISSGFRQVNDLNEKEVIIGDDVWIGFNSTILKGVRIGNGAIVAACSLVTKDIEPYTIVAGNPAVVIKQLEHISR
jgi:acetyltransferase-like isoleucine patch superfamily enzyme